MQRLLHTVCLFTRCLFVCGCVNYKTYYLHDRTALFRRRRWRRDTPTRRSGRHGCLGLFADTRFGPVLFRGFGPCCGHCLVICHGGATTAFGVLFIFKGPFASLVVIVKGKVAFNGHLFPVGGETIRQIHDTTRVAAIPVIKRNTNIQYE